MSIRLPRARLYLAALLCVLTANVFAEDSRTLAASRTAAPASEKKVALVIGNAAYRENPLRNPVNDARAMSAKLKKLGFEVITHENVTALKYGAVLREFRSKLSPGAVALFFYAGHGLQVNGKNYLPAVDAQIQGEEDVPMQSLDLNQVLLTLEDSKTRMNLVFLDACRNNPYARSFRSAAGGLARVEAPSGTLISYATRPGSVADDGGGTNGLYTTELLKHMETPGQPVEQVLKRVVGGVSDASRGAQEPWMEGSIRGDFYFVPGVPSLSALTPTSEIRNDELQTHTDAARTKYLDALASFTVAEAAFQRFTEYKLKAPIRASLTEKRKLMQAALDAYSATRKLDVVEFSSATQYRTAEIYRILAAHLMTSERPSGLDDVALEQYANLLQEQALPFEDKAVEVHTENTALAKQGIYDDWVKKSFKALAALRPTQFAKKEKSAEPANFNATAQHSELSGPLENQVLMHISQENWDSAMESVTAALKVSPRSPFFWNIRGIVLREQGKFSEARAAYEQALMIDPQYTKAHFNLGVLADLYLQDTSLAISHYAQYQALQNNPDATVSTWIADLRNRLGIGKPADAG